MEHQSRKSALERACPTDRGTGEGKRALERRGGERDREGSLSSAAGDAR